MNQVFSLHNTNVLKYALVWKEPCQVSETLVLDFQEFPVLCCC